jgi:hypothetical protein
MALPLAGVDEDLLALGGVLRHLAYDWRDLHEIGPRTHDVENLYCHE